MKHGYAVESDVSYPDTGVPSMSGADLRAMIDAGKAPFILDIRDNVDFSVGNIPGSVNIALDDMDTRWEEIPADRNVVLLDRHGKQVRTAARYLSYRGLDNLRTLENGFIDGWKELGYPVEEVR